MVTKAIHTRRLKICPWCEGKQVTGRMAYGEEPDSVTICGITIPVIGTMLDVPCGYCEGVGVVLADQSQEDRWAEIHAKRKESNDGE